MRIAPYDAARHYPEMERIWRCYGWLPCPKRALPNRGLVAERDDGRFIAYLGMYAAGGMGFIDWALRDPEIGREESDPAFAEMFRRLVEGARADGAAFIYSMTKTAAWGRKLESYGMLVAERDATTYILPLDGGDTDFISDD